MGFAEDRRQLSQACVTAEIEAIDARLRAVERKVASFEARILSERLTRVEANLGAKLPNVV
jgi:hypothetical protein